MTVLRESGYGKSSVHNIRTSSRKQSEEVAGKEWRKVLLSFSSRFSPASRLTVLQIIFQQAKKKKMKIMISLPAQRDEGRTKCRVSRHVAHLVARMFKAFTNLKEKKINVPS